MKWVSEAMWVGREVLYRKYQTRRIAVSVRIRKVHETIEEIKKASTAKELGTAKISDE